MFYLHKWNVRGVSLVLIFVIYQMCQQSHPEEASAHLFIWTVMTVVQSLSQVCSWNAAVYDLDHFLLIKWFSDPSCPEDEDFYDVDRTSISPDSRG